MITDGSETSEMPLREAFFEDIPAMAEHYRLMFEEISDQKGEHLDIAKAGDIEKAYALKLRTELKSGICRTWVIEDDGKTVASGGVTFVSFVPNLSDLSSKVAYLHGMYTEKSHRNRKCAQRIIDAATQHCRAHGVNRMILTASEAGRPIYEKIEIR